MNRKKTKSWKSEDHLLHQISGILPGVLCRMYFDKNAKPVVSFCGPGCDVLFGFSSKTLHRDASPIFTRIHPDDLTEFIESFRKVSENTGTSMPGFRFEHPERGEIRIEARLAPRGGQDDSNLYYLFFREIAEKRSREEEISTLNFALENISEAIFLMDDASRFVYVNRQACESLGYSREELLRLSVPDIDPEFSIERWENTRGLVKEQGRITIESRHRTKGGRFFPVEVSSSLFEYEGRSYNLASVRDISEQKRVQYETLLLNHAINSSTEAAYLMNNQGRFVYVNDSACSSLGYTRDELLSLTPLEINPDMTPETFYPMLRNLLTLGPTQGTLEMNHRRKDGSIFAVELAASMIEFDGERYALTLVRDITERKHAEENLRASELRFRTLAENSPDNIMRMDREGRLTYVNPCMRKTWGFPPGEEIEGKTALEIFGKDMEIYHKSHLEVIENNSSVTCDYTVPDRGDGEEYHNIRVVQERNDEGEVTGALAIGRDITEIKRIEKERKAHMDFLENLDRVNRAIQEAENMDTMMGNVLDLMLLLFDCDRAYLAFPCDPGAVEWEINMEKTRPEFPGLFAQGTRIPVSDKLSEIFRRLIASGKTEQFESMPGELLSGPVVDKYNIKRLMTIAFFPGIETAWQLGIHRCADNLPWNKEEERLFEEIGRRLADGLRTLLVLRDLQKTQERLKLAQQIARVGYWERNFVSQSAEMDDETARNFGMSPGPGHFDLHEWQKIWPELIHPEDREKAIRVMEDSLQHGVPYDIEYRIVISDGSLRYLHSQAVVEKDEFGTLLCMRGMVQDITDRKLAEEKIKKQEREYRDLADNLPVVVVRYDRRYRRIYANRHYEEVSGLRFDQVVGKSPREKSSPLSGALKQFTYDSKRALVRGETIEVEVPPDRTGEMRNFLLRIVPEHDEKGAIASLLTVWTDITGLKTLEKSLRESEARYHEIFDNASDGLLLIENSEGNRLRSVEGNTALLLSTGLEAEEISRRFVDEWENRETAKVVAELAHLSISKEKAIHRDTEIQSESGTRFFSLSSIPLSSPDGSFPRVLLIFRDTTARTLFGKLSFQKQRIELLGELASGIAHDFKNILGVIMLNVGLLRIDIETPMHLSCIDKIHSAAERAADMIRQMLSFRQGSQPEFEYISLARLLNNDLHFLKSTSKSDTIVFECDLPEQGYYIHGDSTQIRQVVLNLCVNAIQAMSEGEGILSISLSRLVLQENEIPSRYAILPPGEYNVLTISDTGEGMGAEVQARAFDPLYTTRSDGTGLGLSIVQSIVEKHSGLVVLSSTPGKGTTFEVVFPGIPEA